MNSKRIAVGIAILTTAITFRQGYVLTQKNSELRTNIDALRVKRVADITKSEILDPSFYEVIVRSVNSNNEPAKVLLLLTCDLTVAACKASVERWTTAVNDSRVPMNVETWLVVDGPGRDEHFRHLLPSAPRPFRVMRVRSTRTFVRRTGIQLFPTALVIDHGSHIAAIFEGRPSVVTLDTCAELLSKSSAADSATLIKREGWTIRWDQKAETKSIQN